MTMANIGRNETDVQARADTLAQRWNQAQRKSPLDILQPQLGAIQTSERIEASLRATVAEPVTLAWFVPTRMLSISRLSSLPFKTRW